MTEHGIRFATDDPDANVVELAAHFMRERRHSAGTDAFGRPNGLQVIQQRDVRRAQTELGHTLKVAKK